MIKKYIFCFCAFAVFSTADAQTQTILSDIKLSGDFQAQVKSLEEFQARFNGTEKKPETEMGNDSLTRVNNIISLFDFQMDKNGLSKDNFIKMINCFVDSVMINRAKFDMLSPKLFSECKCKFNYKGKFVYVTLFLQKEAYAQGRYRWALMGVKGLKEAKIVATDKIYPISPVEHEIYFIGFQDLFNENPSHAFGYKSKTANIDQLSVLLALIQESVLKFDIVEEQIFHCLDVPGYVFTIQEKARPGRNAGWLINKLIPATNTEKMNYIKKMYEN